MEAYRHHIFQLENNLPSIIVQDGLDNGSACPVCEGVSIS